MKSSTLNVLLMLSCVPLFSQMAAIPADSLSIVYGSSPSVDTHTSYDLRYGIWQTDFSKLNRVFAAAGYAPVNNQIRVVAFALTNLSPVRNGLFHLKVHFDYMYFLPQEQMLSNQVTRGLTGYALGFGFGKDLFQKSKYFDLVISLGFQTGRLKLLWTDPAYLQNKSVYSNPFFAPQLIVQPRILLGHFSLGLRAGYQYDITSGNWHHADKSLNAQGEAYMRGYTFEGLVGFRF